MLATAGTPATAGAPAILDMQATECGPASPEIPAIAGRPAKVIKIRYRYDTSNSWDASKSRDAATTGGRRQQ